MAKVLVIDDDELLRAEVRTVLGAEGFEVFEAEDGQAGLSAVHAFNPELVLLDFVMPRMNGVQFASALRSIANRRGTPIVLLSGRTEAISDAFMERLGISEVVKKPFDPGVLTGVVRHVLADKKISGQLPVPVLTAEAASLPQSSPSGLGPLASFLGRYFLAEGRAFPSLDGYFDRALAEMTDEELASMAMSLVARNTGLALAGNLEQLSLIDVLQTLGMQRKSGVLEIASGTRRILVQLTQGYLEMAMLNGASAEHWLGRYLVAEELVTRQDLEMLLRNRSPGYLLGRQVVALGYASDEDMDRALARQSADILYEALRWQHGAFVFRAGARLQRISGSANRLDVNGLIMEGLRRVDEWRVFEREIPHLDIVFEPRPHLGAAMPFEQLSTEERFVHQLVNGRRSVRRIVEESGFDSFSIYQYLYCLIQAGFVVRGEG
jgi:CheY-like chemotaxis protein